MARLASGDRSAAFTLSEHYGNRVLSVVRRQLNHLNYGPVDGGDLRALVLDACMALAEVAGAWRPGGATPWNWAEGRIRAVVNSWVGVHTSTLDDDRAREIADDACAAACHEPDLDAMFARLAHETPIVSLVRDAAREARVDDAAFLLVVNYRIHQDQGDPSPAHTLAAQHGLTPETVRQRVSRTRKRMRAVIETDERFAELADLAMVA